MTIRKNRFPDLKKISFALAVAIALGSGLPTPGFSQSLSREAMEIIQFKPPREGAPRNTVGGGIRGNVRFIPPRTSAPRQTAGGGARGDLAFADPSALSFRPPRNPTPERTVGSGIRGESEQEIVALLPDTNFGYTLSARPTIYIYVPPTAARQVFFSIQGENFPSQYQTILDISGEGGIISVTLPESAPELEVGKNYVWFFAPIEANGILLPDNATASGWIKRIAPLPSTSTASLTPVERAALYAQNGIWYDTLAELAKAQQAQPENTALTREWDTLLAGVGLEKIADRALAERL